MLRVERPDELVRHRKRSKGSTVAFVPTMGALHAGHLSLVRLAKQHADTVIASVFVNPKQFGPGEDFARYPRDLEADARLLDAEGCDLLFAPRVDALYPRGFQTEVRVPELSRGLCGDHRPGHFDGVATVVAKLLNLARPDVAVFGEKDFQQLAIIRRLVTDLSLDVRILGAPIVREPDGLAMSSRNAYLSADDRARAASLSRGLFAAKAAYAAGERGASALLAVARAELEAASVVPEYLELRSFEDLRPLDRAEGPSVLLVAAQVGTTRLIDNLVLERPEPSGEPVTE
jgi:pantoate--beta-alanine ligase